jgi:hypothetical protein
MNTMMFHLVMTAALCLAVEPVSGGPNKVLEVDTRESTIASLKANVAYLMSIPEDELIALVPDQSGIWFTDCPNCDKATQDWGNWNWDPRDPRHITCTDCGAVFPDNPDYPETGQLEVASPSGPHVYPYWERPSDGYKVYFRARVDSLARIHMEKVCADMAYIWWATKDEAYARRAALILIRFAEVYPGYALKYDYPFREKIFWPYNATTFDHPHVQSAPPRLSKWDWWRYMEVSYSLVPAYDCLRFWPGIAEMADGRAVRVIEQDLITAMVEFALDYEDDLGNMGPTNWHRCIWAGRILEQPQWIHEIVDRFERFLTTMFLHDGHWMETSPSYCSQTVGGISVIQSALDDYADPPGYKHPQTGRNLSRAELDTLFGRYDRARNTLLTPRLPDGRLIPLNDTWWSSVLGGPRSHMEPILLPGLGVTVMGGGHDDAQLHAHLNFTSGTHHKHRDALSLNLFAHGRELLPDIGYTHTKYRAYTVSTISHNTVIVDGRESAYDPKHSGNRLRAFVTDGRGFHLAEAESSTAYADRTSRYRRTMIVVGADSNDSYIVDLFDVRGGDQHDYLLHGSADDDSTARISGAAMSPFAGTLMNDGVEFVEPQGESDGVGNEGAFGFVHAIERGEARDTVRLDMRLTENPTIGTRTWLLPEAGTEIYLGQAPSIRRARSSDAALAQYNAPFFTARRKGRDLQSRYVTVHEPVSGEPRIADVDVRRLPQGTVVTIARPDATDYVVIAANDNAMIQINTPDGPLAVDGRYAMLRVRDKAVIAAHLVGGRTMRMGDFQLQDAASITGRVVDIGATREHDAYGYIDVVEAIPVEALGTLIVKHPDDSTQGYNIIAIEPTTAGTRLFTREDPGFQYANGRIETISYPQRTISGRASQYELLTAKHYQVD